MKKRLAVINDVPVLVKLRKQQLMDEGLPVTSNINSNIDKRLADYFTSAHADGSFISWVMENDDEIIATSGVCFYTLPPNFSNGLRHEYVYQTRISAKRNSDGVTEHGHCRSEVARI